MSSLSIHVLGWVPSFTRVYHGSLELNIVLPKRLAFGFLFILYNLGGKKRNYIEKC